VAVGGAVLLVAAIAVVVVVNNKKKAKHGKGKGIEVAQLFVKPLPSFPARL
jgi:hypothetical protein